MADLNIDSTATASDDGGDSRWVSVGHPGADLVLSFLGEMCSTDPVFAKRLLQLVNISTQQHQPSGSSKDDSGSDKNSERSISGSDATVDGDGGGGDRDAVGDKYSAAAVAAALRNRGRAVSEITQETLVALGHSKGYLTKVDDSSTPCTGITSRVQFPSRVVSIRTCLCPRAFLNQSR